ncbi:MAG: hypothetical protein HC876_09920 [Chloroflexaceae bacterium]|nr:hypothetical protein [Chloroflexaceae bacterium]NJO05800.1 hypothetical protein [Chloroflexaceae bacterium]
MATNDVVQPSAPAAGPTATEQPEKVGLSQIVSIIISLLITVALMTIIAYGLDQFATYALSQ